MVLGLCRVLLRDAQEAEDAAQQTFLSAYRSLLGGTEPAHPAAWLATIARNECWGRIRERMHEPLGEPAEEAASDLPDPLQAAIKRADLGALWKAIEALPRQQREALLLREFSGLSYGELAEALQVSEPAVESLLFRARRELRVRLQPVFYPTAIAPLFAVRDALVRVVPGFGDGPASTLAKLAALPVAAKLAAGAATVGIVAGGAVVVEANVVGGGRAKPVTPAVSVGRTIAPPAAAGDGVSLPVLRLPVRDVSGERARSGGSDQGKEGGVPLRAEPPSVPTAISVGGREDGDVAEASGPRGARPAPRLRLDAEAEEVGSPAAPLPVSKDGDVSPAVVPRSAALQFDRDDAGDESRREGEEPEEDGESSGPGGDGKDEDDHSGPGSGAEEPEGGGGSSGPGSGEGAEEADDSGPGGDGSGSGSSGSGSGSSGSGSGSSGSGDDDPSGSSSGSADSGSDPG